MNRRGAPPKEEARVYVHEDYETDRARWLLFAALAQQYPEKMHKLFRILPYLNAIKNAPSSEAFSIRVSKYHDVICEWMNTMGLITTEKEFFVFPRRIEVNEYDPQDFVRIFGSNKKADRGQKVFESRWDSWVSRQICDILENIPNNEASSVAEFALSKAESVYRDRVPSIDHDGSGLPNFNITYTPTEETQQDFMSRLNSEGQKYALAVRSWYERNGFAPAEKRRVEMEDFTQLAHLLAGGFTEEDLLERDGRDLRTFRAAIRKLVRVIDRHSPSGACIYINADVR